MFLRWYRDGQRGPSPAMPAPGYTWSQLRELNRAIRLKHRRESGSQIMRGFARSYRQVLTLVEGLSPGELLEPGRFAWTGKYPLTAHLAPNTCSHYRFATKVLRRWLRANASAHQPRSRPRSR